VPFLETLPAKVQEVLYFEFLFPDFCSAFKRYFRSLIITTQEKSLGLHKNNRGSTIKIGRYTLKYMPLPPNPKVN